MRAGRCVVRCTSSMSTIESAHWSMTARATGCLRSVIVAVAGCCRCPMLGPVTGVRWLTRMRRCLEPGCVTTTFTEPHPVARPSAVLTVRAVRPVGHRCASDDATTVSALDRYLGVACTPLNCDRGRSQGQGRAPTPCRGEDHGSRSTSGGHRGQAPIGRWRSACGVHRPEVLDLRQHRRFMYTIWTASRCWLS